MAKFLDDSFVENGTVLGMIDGDIIFNPEDVFTVLDALEQVQAGDRAAVDSPAVRAAVTEVNRRYSQGCGVYDRRGGI